MSKDLPEFNKPPVIEVALSVQFNELPKLEAAHLGQFWVENLRDELPLTTTKSPLPPQFESFGIRQPGGISFEILDSPPIPRCWFMKELESELVQFQSDRLIHNWRKVGDDQTYPRYESIRKHFKSDLEKFNKFVKDNELGPLSPNQCEVTYVNHITAGEGWANHADAGEVFSFTAVNPQKAFLPSPEAIDSNIRFVIEDIKSKEPIGRLHITSKSVIRTIDQKPAFILTLTARGRPQGNSGIDGVIGFMDIGREWVVRGFADVTTSKMHKVWERKR